MKNKQKLKIQGTGGIERTVEIGRYKMQKKMEG